MGIFDNIGKIFGGQDSEPGAKMESAQEQPKEDLDLCSFVKNKIEEIRGQANRITSEGVWMTNIAYVLGFDSVYYDPALRQYRPNDKSSRIVRRNRIHANLILPACQNRLARMLKSPPKYDVRPNSQEEDDKEAAELGIEVINMVWDKQAINRKRIDHGMWKMQCGHAYIKVTWDDQLGEPLPSFDGSDQIAGYEGDVRIDVVSALEVFPDPLAKTWDDVSYVIQAKVRKLDYFRLHYPERGELVKEEGAWLLSSQYEMRINSLNTGGPSNSGTSEQMKNAAIELSYYEKRSKKYPNGRHVIVANGVLLKNDDLPCGEIPFSKFDDVVVGGKYNSESLITHARPLQDHYNRVLVKRKVWSDTLLAGKFVTARGHNIGQESLTDSTEVLEYDPVPNAQEPHAMQIPVMPQYAYTESAETEKTLNQIFGLSDVSRGILPSSSIPAQGMQILIEQDETRIGIETEQDEHSWARVGMLILKTYETNCKTDRKLKSRNGADYSVKTFNGQMLKGNTDVTVIRGSTIPNSKTLKRQDILNAYQQGLMGNPQDPVVREEVWSMLEYGDTKKGWEKVRIDKNQINRTIQQMEQGIAPIVNKGDNHLLHIDVKNDYRKSEKWDLLSPDSQMLMQQDMDTHAQMAAMLANPQLMNPPPMPPPPMSDAEAASHLGISPQGTPVDNQPVMPQNNSMGVQ